MKNNQNSQKNIDKTIKEYLKKVFEDGLMAGMKTMCEIILTDIDDAKLSDSDKIKKIKTFCTKTASIEKQKGK